MFDVPESKGLGTSKDPMEIVVALRNSSLDGCKENFLPRGSFDDDNDDRGQEHGVGGQTGHHARVIAVNSGRASGNPLSDSGNHSGHDDDESVANKEDRMEDNLVDYDSDPYDLAMRDQQNIASDSVFYIECHNRVPNIPLDKVCFLLFPLLCIWFFFFF